MSKSKINIYKPFEYLFYRIECFYDYIGVSGYYGHVSLAVTLFQVGNLVFIYSVIKNPLRLELGFYFGIAIYISLFLFNAIYFKEKKVNVIFDRYRLEERKRKIQLGIVVVVYIIVSIILFVFSQRGV
jgi:hypothetical protein